MKYENIYEAVFLERPNRFIAYVRLSGDIVVCHVKNTGRCRELLVPGARVYIQHNNKKGRKTMWDLIAVIKNDILINIDSAAPNTVFSEWLCAGGLGYLPDYVRPETRFGDSRLDFYFRHAEEECFAEVKGVTLEDNGVVRFPDAPTERGVKHLQTLISCVNAGYIAYAVFIIQLKGAGYFEPNYSTDPEFARALRLAKQAGVELLALDCDVHPDSLTVSRPVEILL